LEIQQQFEDGMHIERQMLLSRRHRLLMMADCIAQSRGPIQYRTTLPLAAGVRAVADGPTRELRLSTQDVSARVFPVALPDDRLRSATGDVRLADGRLEYQQSGEKGLFAPLVFDWHP